MGPFAACTLSPQGRTHSELDTSGSLGTGVGAPGHKAWVEAGRAQRLEGAPQHRGPSLSPWEVVGAGVRILQPAPQDVALGA